MILYFLQNQKCTKWRSSLLLLESAWSFCFSVLIHRLYLFSLSAVLFVCSQHFWAITHPCLCFISFQLDSVSWVKPIHIAVLTILLLYLIILRSIAILVCFAHLDIITCRHEPQQNSGTANLTIGKLCKSRCPRSQFWGKKKKGLYAFFRNCLMSWKGWSIFWKKLYKLFYITGISMSLIKKFENKDFCTKHWELLQSI